ncbi:MAG: tetratricopeptide repeat protein, partial [Verrucomicrobiae bacterium]|nr:tetratricopeptide repeat protein [Verrucomicrobiae bacterium]
PLPQLRRIVETLLAIARVHEIKGDISKAIARYQEAVALHDITASTVSPTAEPSLGKELLPLLSGLGRLHFAQNDLEESEAAYQRLLSIANVLRKMDSVDAWEASVAAANALHALGSIETMKKELEAALTLYREEVGLREEILESRPYDSDTKVNLATAYESIADSLDASQPAQRSVALYHLERAVSLLGELPPQLKNDPAIQSRMLAFHDRISEILEMEE